MIKEGSRNILYVEDGEEFSVIVMLRPSVNDPALSQPSVSQSFRVIANSYGPTLKLVSLTDTATVLAKLPEQAVFTYDMCSRGLKHDDYRDGFLHDCSPATGRITDDEHAPETAS
jgi:hypothetical protein